MRKIEITELSKAERQFLGRKGISANEWNSLSEKDQLLWKKEMNDPEKTDYDRHPNKQFTH